MMIPSPSVSYEERRRELALLERLTAEARLQLTQQRHLIRAPSVETSEEGILISKILGIFLFLFLLVGMLLFFHKETDCTARWWHRVKRGLRRLGKALRHKLFRFDRIWSCEEEVSSSSDGSGPGVYRTMSDNDVTEMEPPSSGTMFDHRQALLELFADLELHHEVVQHSLRGYNAALTRLDERTAAHARPDAAPSAAPPDAVKVAPLPGILRVPAAALGTRSHHRHGHHRHHHHHHKHRRCETIAEEHHENLDQDDSDVTQEARGDVTLNSRNHVTPEMSNDTKSAGRVTGTSVICEGGGQRTDNSDSGYCATDESDDDRCQTQNSAATLSRRVSDV
ncbi:uncharacterized protein LOC122392729 [Amphibalanus amphitrite]|uniref:uncharacterized protein LOC122392729 n=1 Tax=Amphibalanus amphitrite TaxID=1232801 RepID=UPI001C900921|nr:uncharacterized protein LOC122392729 [Amphibalanus amphitrite]